MKKHIILSVNDNPDYLYFVPLTCWAWRKFGWEPVLFYHRLTENNDRRSTIRHLEALTSDAINTCEGAFNTKKIKVDGYKGATIAQISRLYAAAIIDDGYIMTGDIDMLPLSDYWQPNPNTFTVWGHDLTGYGHYPICYLGGTTDKWREVMDIDSSDYNALIKRGLDTLPQAKSDDFNKYWFCDQDLITQRLKPFNPTVINRGQYGNGFARGRVDRGAWTLEHKEYIDCHMHHQIHHKGNEWKFSQTMAMLRKAWPDEDFEWFVEYHEQFKELTGHV